ncbi:MAG: serine hydrolase domain-containing protein [Chitinophagaceae bacterium]
MKKILAIFLTAITFTTMAQPGGDRVKKIEAAIPVIDKMFSDFTLQNRLPGMIYGLVVDGKLVHTLAKGYSDVEKKIVVTTSSEFRIASMTKSFTAMAVLKLRDEGKLNLDDPISLYIPEMKGQRYLTSDATPITIRHLMTHAAGFPEDNPWGDRQLAVSDEEMLRMIKKGISFSNSPGLYYEYSNMGFALLGYLIKKVSGQSYENYITANILVPLGMTHTYWEYDKVPAAALAHGYRRLNNKYVEQPLLLSGSYGAMGGLITSIEDFGKYVAFHLSAWPPSDKEETGPVKRSSVREMHHLWNFNSMQAGFKYASGRACPLISGYGYGLRINEDCDNRLIIGHSGGLPGFGSDWKILPDYGIGIISFGNLTYSPNSGINLQVLDTLVTLARLKPRPVPVSEVLNQRKKQLIEILPGWKNAEAVPIFAENFFLDYFPDSLRKQATLIFGHAGKILRVGEFVATNNLRGYFIMEGENKNIEVSFTLTPEAVPLIQEYKIWEREK